MNESIFSTYSTAENRVTASILAVLQCLALPRIERILGALMEDADFRLIQFQNQPKGDESVPDAVIAGSFRILLETKIVRNALKGPVARKQLEGHLAQLRTSREMNQVLLAITPDDVQPELITAISNDLLKWSSFSALNQAIEDLLTDEMDEKEVISEREEFLLRELQKMLLAEKNLIGSSKEILVIPARNAWPIYQQVHAYICQPERSFQPVKYIAFYEKNTIHPIVPKILEQPHERILFEENRHDGLLGVVVSKAIEKSDHVNWPYYKYRSLECKVFVLSAPDAPETIKLDQAIANNLERNGQRIAFTQNQRYLSLDRLKKAKTTSDLV